MRSRHRDRRIPSLNERKLFSSAHSILLEGGLLWVEEEVFEHLRVPREQTKRTNRPLAALSFPAADRRQWGRKTGRSKT
jgi:hypothetical protein